MSTSLAIAAVTTTLRHLLQVGVKLLDNGVTPDSEVTDLQVTAQPPDKARGTNAFNQLNLFLYQTTTNAAWRNRDMPRLLKPGETGMPPLPLDLYYLITAYGRENEDVFAHRLLGRAMRLLHDHALLGAKEIKDALAQTGLDQQPERVRLTLQPLSVEEISKLWMVFQAPYRMSAAYQVSVVLIESTLPAKAPLPVIVRGPGDSGIVSQADVLPRFPALEAFYSRPPVPAVPSPDEPPEHRQPGAQIGDDLTLYGSYLNGSQIAADSVAVQFSLPLLDRPIVVPLGAPATEYLELNLNAALRWVVGNYRVTVLCRNAATKETQNSNDLFVPLAPRIDAILPRPLIAAGNGDVKMTVNCTPKIREDQTVTLLLGDKAIGAVHPGDAAQFVFIGKADPTNPQIVRFDGQEVVRGNNYYVRLRVDGVDSLLLKDYSAPVPAFNNALKVTIP